MINEQHTEETERKNEHCFEGKASVIIAALSFGFIFSIYSGSWVFYFLMGPISWFAAIVLGAIAVIKEDTLGYVGVGLAYLIFLGNVLLVFSH